MLIIILTISIGLSCMVAGVVLSAAMLSSRNTRDLAERTEHWNADFYEEGTFLMNPYIKPRKPNQGSSAKEEILTHAS